MPTECNRDQFGYEAVEGRQVVAAFDGGQVSSDAGALLLGATNRAIGLVQRLAGCFAGGRAQELVEHTVETMLMQRICGIALGYEDLVDHDELRHDPVLATLAGKSTLNRLEHAPVSALDRYHKISHDHRAIENLFVALFLDAHTRPPQRIVLDLDATDDPVHGHQEGRLSIPPRALRFTATMIATATCRCTSSAAATCSPPSCAAPTSMPRRARSRRSRASSARSVPTGRGSRSC